MTAGTYATRTWTYGGVPLPAAVLTSDAIDDATVLDRVHAELGAHGIAVAAVRGAPFVWRAAGYDYALDSGAGVLIDTVNLPGTRVAVRAMTPDDVSVAAECFDRDARRLVVAEQRDPDRWAELLAVPARHYDAIVDADGAAVGYAAWAASGDGFEMVELAGLPTVDLRDVALCALRSRADGTPTRMRLGPRHPVYDVLGGRVLEAIRPGAWYVRVLDLVALLAAIRPALDARLGASLLRSASTALVLHDYDTAVELEIDGGRVTGIGPAAISDAAAGTVAAFPPGVLWKVVFGRHLLDEVEAMFPDVVVDPPIRRFVNTLFVAGPSHVDAGS